MNQFETIKSILKEFESETLRIYWNMCTGNKESYHKQIYPNENMYLLDIYGPDITEALRAAQYGNYDFSDEYFTINEHGNLESFNSDNISQYIDYDELTEYVIEHGCPEMVEIWYEDIIHEFSEYAFANYALELNDDVQYSVEELIKEDWDYLINDLLDF